VSSTVHPVSPRPAVETPGWRFLTPLLVGSALNPINSSIIATALVAIGRGFDVGPDSTASLIGALYLASAIGQPAMGKLGERLGPRRVFLAGLVLVGAGGLLGALAVSLPMLVVARVVLGLGTSAGYPTAMMILRRWAAAHPSASTGGSLGALAIAGQVTATIGLPLGGVLVALGGWQITFLINIPLALAGVVLTLLWVPRDVAREVASGPRESAVDALDPGGLVLFAGLMASLLFFLGDLRHPRWVLVGAVCVLLAALVRWELRARHPFIDVRLLVRNRALTMTYVRVAVTFLITYCVFYGLTQWLEEQRGLSAGGAGLVMLPMSVLAVLISVPFSRRNMVRSALVATAGGAVVGSVGLLVFTSSTPLWVLTLVITVFGVCSGLGMIGNQAALYQQAPAEHVGVAAGLMRTFMYTGAILSSSLISASFGERATDPGLRVVTLVLLGLGALLVLLTLVGARGLHGPSAGTALRG
jgi:MFS family permease